MGADPGPALRALARGRAAGLLAELWDQGPTEGAAGAWAGLLGPWPADADARAVLHQQVAVEAVPPYASVFLHEAALVGQDEDLAALRAELGLSPPAALPVDHLAEELRLFAVLCGIERQAWQGEADLARVQADQGSLLDGHLLRWVPAFVVAVRGLGAEAGPYGPAADLLLDLLLDARAALPGAPAAWDLPPLRPGLLDDAGTDLARIARRLCTPALAGGHLSGPVLHRVGRGLGLPRGFGARWQQLESLLHAGAHYGQVPQVVAALDAELCRWDAGHAALPEALAPLRAPWRARIAESRALLATLAEAARAAPTPGTPDPA